MPYDVANPKIIDEAKIPSSDNTAEQLISALNLEEHLEGGCFRQTFSADHRPKDIKCK
jgi:predicted cupin superfamily sugar epimerase